MTITTSKGKTFAINWAWNLNLMGHDTLMIELFDDRPILEVGADFDGCDIFYRQSEDEGDMTFEGFSNLSLISHPDPSTRSRVQINLVKDI